jgi:hypothetical protein
MTLDIHPFLKKELLTSADEEVRGQSSTLLVELNKTEFFFYPGKAASTHADRTNILNGCK